MASELGYKPAFVMGIANSTANAILKNITLVANECHADVSVGSETTLIDRLHSHIRSNTKKLQTRLFT